VALLLPTKDYIMVNVFDFSIDVFGDSTGERWLGDFKGKLRLSHRDQMAKDVTKRVLLGDNAQFASQDTIVRVEMFAHLGVSLTQTPSWWKEKGNGLDLFDDNVVIEVYEKLVAEQTKVISDIKKKGEADKAALAEKK
jgi:hypothetical protein